MGLFDQSQMEAINRAAQKSKQSLANAPKPVRINSLNADLEAASNTVREYFKNSNAIIITDRNELHEYISKIIEYGFASIDTETTGLDKLHDYIVGASLYAPNVPEAYIPLKHRIPIFEDFYRGQLSYEDTTEEFQRLVDAGTKLIFANADFDLSMIYKDLNIDFCDNFHYDVILAWRCIKENEQKNGLKELYNKYVLKGKGDPKRFSDFFSPSLFPYAKPEVAGLYAANDAKITFELYKWQLPYVLKDSPKCQKNHLERIADLVWNLEFPLVKICQMMHRDGMAVDLEIMKIISKRYHEKYLEELAKLRVMVQEVLDNNTKPISGKQWITSGDMFNPDSAPQVKYLCYNLMGVIDSSSGTGKDVLTELNLPITNQILLVRSLSTLLGMFVDKLPSLINPKDGKIHASFKQLGASTGRFSCISEGIKISCPKGDTPIELLEVGDYVYCYDTDTNKLKLSKVKNVWFTGVRECVKISWVSKYNKHLKGDLICTPDHFLRTQDFRWVMAKDLKPSDSLLYVHRRINDNCVSLSAVNGQGNEEEHAWIRDNFYGHSGAQENFLIHHKDRNRLNNDPNNLVLGTNTTHNALHSAIPGEDNNYGGRYNFGREKLIQMGESVNWELTKLQYDISSVYSWMRNHRINYILKYTESYSKRCYIVSGSKSYKWLHLPLSKSNLTYSIDLADGDLAVAASYFGVSLDEFTSACDKYHILSNHSVVSVEYLDTPYRVYDIEVEGYHNFIAGELCVHNSADPNMQQIPSKAEDIRHIFRATPGYVLLSSDYSAQEPRITSYLGSDAKLIKSFQEGKDVYATIASEAYNVPYERCLEFHPETHEYQPDGKQRRSEAKKIFLGIAYGRSIKSIGEQIYGTRTDMSEKEKEQGAKRIYDAVVNSFSGLKMLMHSSQSYAKKYGYVETILGRRRHIPDMQLSEFEFKALPGYVNPLLDPLNPDTFEDTSDIPETTVKALTAEFKKYKRWGQIVRRTEQLYNEKIKVINNRKKITDASRQCLNCVDTETEILTISGWKHYNEISIGEHIYAFDMETERIVLSHIEDVFEYEGEIPVVEFRSRSMSAVSTLKHRWVVTACNSGNPTIKSTEVLMSSSNVNYPIIRSGLNGMEDDRHWNTNFIKIFGWVYGSGNFWDDGCPSIVLNVGRKYNRVLINEIKECLVECGIVFESYTKNWNTVIKLVGNLPEPLRQSLRDSYMPTNAFSQFSASQSMLLMDSMIDGCGYSHSFGRTACYVCNTEVEVDRFQHIAFLAGYSTTVRKSDRVAGAYIVTVLRNERAHITKKHCTEKAVDKVWCVSTPHKTWIARRHGTTYITGNSMVQGSAADQTKMAMIALCKDPDWQRIGGRILIPIHDELLCEVPVEYWKEGGEILSRVMCDAASFLPFDSKCDVTTSIHWMGLEYPCPYSKPDSIEDLDSLSESEIKWVQYHLIENEYPLPVYKDEDGNKPRGDAAKGVNGVNSPELDSAVDRYCTHFRITRDEFIHHIESRLNTN